MDKVKTAIRIIKEEGWIAFFRKSLLKIRSFGSSTTVDELNICYQALEADDKQGLMIDVGAHQGGSLAPFSKAGWKVFAFEPDLENREELTRKYGSNPLVQIDPRAVSNQPASNVILYKSEQSSGISSLTPFHESHQEGLKVDVITLSGFLAEQQLLEEKIEFLKIDTEGYDYFVLQGFPWDKVSPDVILCEFEDAKSKPLGYLLSDLADYLQVRSYRLIVSEWFPVQAYGSTHRWRRFATYPCELLDPKAWGNIIAARDPEVFSKLSKACHL
ncbi:MAG: FkbM family methyltransferase [Anaerolineales bacterium]|nr:FkbM family methyltransferase [Anaerolineales bacterium]